LHSASMAMLGHEKKIREAGEQGQISLFGEEGA